MFIDSGVYIYAITGLWVIARLLQHKFVDVSGDIAPSRLYMAFFQPKILRTPFSLMQESIVCTASCFQALLVSKRLLTILSWNLNPKETYQLKVVGKALCTMDGRIIDLASLVSCDRWYILLSDN